MKSIELILSWVPILLRIKLARRGFSEFIRTQARSYLKNARIFDIDFCLNMSHKTI